MTAPQRWAWRALQLVLVVGVTWALFRAIGIDLGELNRTELARWRPDARVLALSVALLVAIYLAHALLWRRVLGDLLGARPRIGTTLRIYFLSNLARYLPGRLWQMAGMAVLAQRAGLPPVGATACAIIGQFAFVLTGTLFLTVLLPGWAGAAPALAAAFLLAALAGAFFWLSATRAGARLRGWMGARAGTRLAAVLQVLDRIRFRQALLWGAGYAATWLALALAFALFVAAFVPQALNELRHLSGTMAAAYLTGYIAIFAPAGMGVREGVMGVLLAQVLPGSAALVVAVASRLWFTAAELIVLAALPFMRAGNGAGEPATLTPQAP